MSEPLVCECCGDSVKVDHSVEAHDCGCVLCLCCYEGAADDAANCYCCGEGCRHGPNCKLKKEAT